MLEAQLPESSAFKSLPNRAEFCRSAVVSKGGHHGCFQMVLHMQGLTSDGTDSKRPARISLQHAFVEKLLATQTTVLISSGLQRQEPHKSFVV